MIFLFGFLTGLALVAPIGPVALTLFGIGAEQGRRAALAGAGGVVLADVVTMPVALAGAGFLGGLDAGIVRWLEIAMGLSLVVLALATMVHADRARQAVGSIRRPTPVLAAMTLCNPLSVVAWIGLALALPASIRTPMSLAAFGLGVVVASALWHAGLAAASGTYASRLGLGPRTVITRISGLVLLAVGGVLVV